LSFYHLRSRYACKHPVADDIGFPDRPWPVHVALLVHTPRSTPRQGIRTWKQERQR
jgi:hypothetical protein